ncbi:TadE/TadG family type IV pilus assembly protein [Cellulomonas sp. URHB0016]
MRARLRAARDEAGVASIELVSYSFVIVLCAMLCVQGIFLTQATSAAQQAARDGARAHALGRDVSAAVDRSLPSWATLEDLVPSSVGGAYTLRVSVRVPIGLPSFTSTSFVVTRDAVLPAG